MSEVPSQQSPSGPQEPESPNLEPTPTDRGSLIAGVVLAWLVMLGGGAFMFTLGNFGALMWGLAVLLVVIIFWAAALVGQGKSRTGAGMFLGLLSMFAVLLLLVAACFGLVGGKSGNFQ